jgi:ubiquinone/menaquinone biosynthesis C-methylase UbiE
VGRTIRYGELLLGIEGAALFRHLLDDDDEFIEQRVAALRRLASDEKRLSFRIDVPELGVTDGYTAWAPVYDGMNNPLILAEEPLVAAATRDLPIGTALDVACGTGRHAAWLAAAGHATTGIDATPAMLDIARRRAPTVDFRLGDLAALPVDDAGFDFVICALALAHLEDLRPAIREIARAVRPGGRVVLTDAHPTFVLIQGQAVFPTEHGMAYVRNYPHLHGTYFAAFRDAGLAVLDCLEAPMVSDFSSGMFVETPDAAHAFWDDIPAALVWSLAKPE